MVLAEVRRTTTDPHGVSRPSFENAERTTNVFLANILVTSRDGRRLGALTMLLLLVLHKRGEISEQRVDLGA